MGRVIPDKDTLDKVIKERETGENIPKVKPQYIDGEGGGTLYVDKKGLIHKDGPEGKIIDFIGLTDEQVERMKANPDSFMPRPR
jgi:hypothetical protein